MRVSAHTADQFQVMYHVSHSGSIAFSFGGKLQNEPFVNNAAPDPFGRQMRQLSCSIHFRFDYEILISSRHLHHLFMHESFCPTSTAVNDGGTVVVWA